MSRVSQVGIFFALIALCLVFYYWYLIQNLSPKVKQCRGEFKLPEHAYWENECWWKCEEGWVRHVLNSTCQVDQYAKQGQEIK